MPWGKLDDQFDDQPEIDYMSTDAIALFICSITWACRNLTDGHIPLARARKLPGGHNRKAIDELLEGEKPWWIEVPDGFQIRSFLKFNPAGEEFLERREEISRIRSEAGKRGAAARHKSQKQNGKEAGKHSGKTNGKPPGKTEDLLEQNDSKPLGKTGSEDGNLLSKILAPNPESRNQSIPETRNQKENPPNPHGKFTAGSFWDPPFVLPWGTASPPDMKRSVLLRFNEPEGEAEFQEVESQSRWCCFGSQFKLVKARARPEEEPAT